MRRDSDARTPHESRAPHCLARRRSRNVHTVCTSRPPNTSAQQGERSHSPAHNRRASASAQGSDRVLKSNLRFAHLSLLHRGRHSLGTVRPSAAAVEVCVSAGGLNVVTVVVVVAVVVVVVAVVVVVGWLSLVVVWLSLVVVWLSLVVGWLSFVVGWLSLVVASTATGCGTISVGASRSADVASVRPRQRISHSAFVRND